MPSSALRSLFCASIALAVAIPRTVMGTPEPDSAANGKGKVRVILWFDTEDYLLPADDDATKRLCELLSARGIRATFKLVGEKARVLEKRKRTDVIDALRKHDIGFHANYHSVHPTPAEYLAELGWADGIAEFVRREGPGADDLRRILGVPVLSCYGQPGSSWAPQAMAALPQIAVAPGGVPCYVDEGSHVGLGGKPFWYAGALTVYHMSPNVTRMDLHEEGGFEKGCEAFRQIHTRLIAEGGGLISIFYHPCEWVHREFWDGVNFRRGANPPREEWKAPPQRPAEETDAAFRRFEQYVDLQRALPDVTYVTAGDLPSLYPDRVRAEGIGAEAARAIAKEVDRAASNGERIGFFRTGDGLILSAADQFVVLAELLGSVIEKGKLPRQLSVAPALGPSEPPPETEVSSLRWLELRDALLDARDEIRKRKQIPSCVFVGAKKTAPADFLVAMARAVLEAKESTKEAAQSFPEKVEVPTKTRIAAEERIAEDKPGLFGGWIIHADGFRAPRIVEMARLQAWTLKPAS